MPETELLAPTYEDWGLTILERWDGLSSYVDLDGTRNRVNGWELFEHVVRESDVAEGASDGA